jgi:Tfp pilus assembly protein PilN
VAISINLLHEKHKLERQRQRDPLKLGAYLLGGIIACFLAYYLFSWFSVQRVFNDRDDLRARWEKKQRDATQVTQFEAEMKSTSAASNALNVRIEKRFFWGPVLDVLYRTVPGEIQLTNFIGSSPRRVDLASIQLDGIAAGTEPRAVAEKFREALLAALRAKYRDVSCLFRQLEDQAGVTAKFDGKDLPTAKFVMDVRMRKPFAAAAPTPAPPPPKPKPKG